MANAIPYPLDFIRSQLLHATSGMLTWAEMMEWALYAPEKGYYRQGVRRIGRGGDFYTSVSVGPLYGEMLAHWIIQVWQQRGCPAPFTIVEQGAHDGTLAADILGALSRTAPALYAVVRYLTIEPDSQLCHAQSASVTSQHGTRFQSVPNWRSLPDSARQGLLIANELLDALPVHRVIFHQGTWMESYVALAPTGELTFVNGPCSTPRLAKEVTALGTNFPEGYVTEIHLTMLDWLQEVAASGLQGPLLIVDYGMDAESYYAPERAQGTLRRYFQHRMDGQVLDSLGECDLTAHVNFTRLAQEALSLDLRVTEYIEQGRFLTHQLSPLLQKPDFRPDAAWLRQFQTLTHPQHLGRTFQVMILDRGVSPLPDPSSLSQDPDAPQRRLGLPTS